MVFNDTTNLAGLVQDCEFTTKLGYGGISGDTTKLKEFTRLMNTWYHKVITMILMAQDEWDYDDCNHADFPILTTSLVASQQDYSIPLSEKVLQVKRVEITYDGSKWYKAEPFDINERGLATDTTSISEDFDQTKPYYDIQYGSLFLYPIPSAAVTNGLKIWVTREVDEFTTADTTQEPGIDEAFHPMISKGASFEYASVYGLDNKNDIWTVLQDYEARLKTHYGSKEKDRQYSFKSAYQSEDFE